MPSPGKTVALIPARGGSKGLPGKNIRPLGGKPLIQHTIEAALLCPLVDAIYVSTEDAAIREAAETANALVVQRPKELATDEASSLQVVEHFLDWHQAEFGTLPETLVLLQPTSPLRTATHLTEALTRYNELPQPASLVSVTMSKPLTWQGTVDDEGKFIFHDTPDLNGNRQSAVTNYVLNGAIYISTPQRYRAGELMVPFVYSYLMEPESAVDIDTLADFELAESLLRQSRAVTPSGQR